MKLSNKQLTAIGVVIAAISLIPAFLFNGSKTNITDLHGSSLNVNSKIDTQQNYFADTPDPSWENLRQEHLKGIEGEELIEELFYLMNKKQWAEACSLMTKDKCDVQNGEDILEHSREPKHKTVDGYKNVTVWHSDSAPEDTWCVKYQYQERQSEIARDIVLVMQYKLSPRSDGGEDIASRLCEKTWMSGLGERKCSYPASVKYCL